MVNAGYVGRNQQEVRFHIEELKRLGVPGPISTPTLYPMASRIISQEDSIEVYGVQTSGEAEFVLLVQKEKEIYVAAGSDHTDRKLEAVGIAVSKNICPNIISRQVWSFDTILPHWDTIVLRSWVTRGGGRSLYQEETLAAIMHPRDLLDFVRSRMEGSLEDLAIFSGTIGTLGGNLVFGDFFEVELHDPVLKDTLRLSYRVNPMNYVTREE
jgi:hypothetical protein